MRVLSKAEVSVVIDIATRNLVVTLIGMQAALRGCSFDEARGYFEAPDFSEYLADPDTAKSFAYVWEGLIGEAVYDSGLVDQDFAIVHVIAVVERGYLDTRVFIYGEEDADD